MTKTTKLSIFAIVFSIVISLALMGVSVFAALQQSAELVGAITVTDEGQAKSNIRVSYAVGPNNASEYEAMTVEPTLTELVYKTKNEDLKTAVEVIDVDFSYFNNYRYFIYKVEIQNLSSVAVQYSTIFLNSKNDSDHIFDSQIEVLYAKNLTNGGFVLTAGEYDTDQIEIDGSVTYYIIIQVQRGIDLLELLNSVDGPYRMTVTVSA